MKKIFVLFVVFALFFVFSYADTDISGEMEFQFAADPAKDKGYRQLLKTDINAGAAFGTTEIKAVLRAERDTSRLKDTERVYLREGYINQDFFFDSFIQSFNFKAGKIIHTWGNADEMKPVDILNPQDYSFLLLDTIQERKMGVFSGAATIYFPGNIFLEAVALQEYKPNNFESSVFDLAVIPALPEIPLVNYEINGPEIPDENDLAKTPYAIRLGAAPFDIDAHISYFSGYSYMPSVKSEMDGLTINITPFYPETEMLGLDFQRALFSGISIRGEAAYYIKGKFFDLQLDEDDPMDSPYSEDVQDDGDGLYEKHLTEYALGFDVRDMFFKNLYLNFQVSGSHVADYEAVLSRDETINSIVSSLEYTFLDYKAGLSLNVFYNINDEAFVSGLEGSYKISGNYELGAGWWVFEGAGDTYYGRFSDKDMVYVSGKAKF